MARHWHRGLLAGLLAATGAVHAEFKPSRAYEEVADPPTPVRGHAIVGVALPLAADAAKSNRLWVRASGSAAASAGIRVLVTSANGRLRGEGTWRFEATSQPRSWYPLAVPAKGGRPEVPEHLAVAVQPIADDGAATPVYMVSALGDAEPATAAKVRLYVNSRRAEVFVYRQDTSAQPERCRPIEGTQVVRFDAVCDVSIAVGATAGSEQLTLVRRDGHQTSRQHVELRW